MAYADYNDLMKITEEMVSGKSMGLHELRTCVYDTYLYPLLSSGMVQEIHGSYQIQYHPVEDEPDQV